MELQLNKEKDFYGKDVIVIRTFQKDGRIRRVADMWDEDSANRIVKAVNCHDDLVEALKGIIQVAKPIGNSDFEFGKKYYGTYEVYGNRISQALEALAKAEAL